MKDLILDTDTELYNIMGTEYILLTGICYANRNSSTARPEIDIIRNYIFCSLYS
jgi:hypothetical protein